MKKHVIAAAIAAAVAAPAAMAGAPTVYGQINMSVDSITDNGVRVSSNASRIGIKGAEDLGNGLKAIYKIEWGVSIDNTGLLSGRNQYVGVAGGFGAVLLGRHDTPTKMAQPTDTFNDGYGDNKPMAGGLGMLGAGAEIRAKNVLAYVSPSFGGVKLVAALVSGEDYGVTGKDVDLTDAYSVAVMYGSKKKGLYLSAGYDSFSKDITGGKDYSEYRIAAQYTAGALMGNIMYANYDDGNSAVDAATEGSNVQVNLAYTMGAATLKGKYSYLDYKDARKDGNAFGLGVDYALGKKTTTYVEYVNFDKNVADPMGVTAAGKSADYISVGLLHKF